MRRLAVCLSLAVAVTVAADEQSPRPHFLWTVTADGSPPSYLLGSLHVLTPNYYPLSPVIEAAFDKSKVLVEEVDLDEMTNPAALAPLLAKAMLTDGRTLDQVVPADLYAAVIARGEKAGVPGEALQRMKPWMAAVSLTAPALKAEGFDAQLGVDRHFFDKAKERGMERRGLETVAYQFDRLDQMPSAIQVAMLRSVIADLDTELSNVKSIADSWARGDTGAIERLLLGALRESPALYERLLVERNRNWVAAVDACLQQNASCFVVVGAAHLVGSHSLVELLRQKGYKVEQQ